MNNTSSYVQLYLLALLCASALAEPITPIPQPVNLPPEQVELGRILFHDVRLSKGAQLACASCHSLKMGGADGQIVSTGVNRQKGVINSPSIFNSSLNFRQFWDGRSADLISQIDGPITNPLEMDSNWPDILNIISNDPFYRQQFQQAYAAPIDIAKIKHALITFEKSLLTPGSRFDMYLRGNKQAITPAETRGYQLFKQYGCISCHQGVLVGANSYQKMGLFADYFADRGSVTDADLGRFNITGDPQDRHVFKVPGLRNVALTAPYLHDGSQATLTDVIKVMLHYQVGQEATDEEIELISKFLATLTGKYQHQQLKAR